MPRQQQVRGEGHALGRGGPGGVLRLPGLPVHGAAGRSRHTRGLGGGPPPPL
mgnify:CR=1 FL=1